MWSDEEWKLRGALPGEEKLERQGQGTGRERKSLKLETDGEGTGQTQLKLPGRLRGRLGGGGGLYRDRGKG